MIWRRREKKNLKFWATLFKSFHTLKLIKYVSNSILSVEYVISISKKTIIVFAF